MPPTAGACRWLWRRAAGGAALAQTAGRRTVPIITTRALNRKPPPALVAAILFLGIAALITWPMVPQAADTLPDAGDPAESVWTLHWIATALFHDPAHLYAAPIFHGFPNALAYDDTSLLPGILGAPLWLAPNHLLFYNLLIWGTLAALGWTAYLLIRAITGSEVAGVAGGLVCLVNSYNLAHLSHLNVLSAYLLPPALLALYRLFHPGPRGPSPGAALALAGIIVAQAMNTFYILAYLLLAVAGYVAWQVGIARGWKAWPPAWRRRLAGQLLVVALLGGGAIALVALPYVETQQLLGFARTAQENQAWAARPVDYASVSLHNRAYANILPHNEVEPLFPGVTALLLVGAGLLAARRRGAARSGQTPALPSRSEAGFYGVLLVAGVLLTLGPSLDAGPIHLPLPYALLAVLPGGSALRAPVRAMAVVNLALGVWAGVGARTLLGRIVPAGAQASLSGEAAMPARGAWRAALATRAGLLACVAALVGAEQQVAPLALTHLPATAAAIPPVYRWLGAHADAGVLIEMPVGLGLRDPVVEGTRMYYQTWHGHPLVNGYSSFRPPTYVEMLTLIDRQYASVTPEQIGLFQSLDVRYILYHEADYKRSAWTRVAADLHKFPEVHEIGRFPAGRPGDDHLYALDPRPESAVLRLSETPAGFTLENRYRYPLLARLRPTLDIRHHNRSKALITPLLLPFGRHALALAGPALPADPGTGGATAILAPAPPYLRLDLSANSP